MHLEERHYLYSTNAPSEALFSAPLANSEHMHLDSHHVVVCGDQADTIEAGVEKYWRMICTCPTPSNILWMFHGNTAIAVLTSTHWGYRFSLQSNHMPALGP
ncbi:predicted protein [Lichtheimia corymbifera JMRC:FSU:9682]|uniref:Uncharacterized protein n=1 Tax=Lichtheimia corymbifera JMRC:FSU:9682 TaxID=1263082 RepID=A0A068RN83_9FUNG|nr:predicted protein [Lichtheimia corymbifera JMRC:FSU:9682]